MLRFYSRVRILSEPLNIVVVDDIEYVCLEIEAAKDLVLKGLFMKDLIPDKGSIVESEFTYLTNLCEDKDGISIRFGKWRVTDLPIRNTFTARTHRKIVKGSNSRVRLDHVTRFKKITFSLAHVNENRDDVFTMAIAVNSMAKVINDLPNYTYADLEVKIRKDSRAYCMVTKVKKITS